MSGLVSSFSVKTKDLVSVNNIIKSQDIVLASIGVYVNYVQVDVPCVILSLINLHFCIYLSLNLSLPLIMSWSHRNMRMMRI